MAKIVFPIDGSERSKRALPAAEQLAQSLNAELVILTVIDDSQPWTDQPPEDGGRSREDKLQELTNSLSCSSRLRIEQGNSVTEILRVIDEECPNLVLMSSHGQSGLGELALGAVARDVVRQCKLPVTLIGPSAEPERASEALALDTQHQKENVPNDKSDS